MRTRHLFLWALLALPAVAPAEETLPAIRILRTGMFHGNEVDAQSGQTWFGLFSSGEGFHLTAVSVHINQVPDPIMDEDPLAMTGRDVRIDGEQDPMILLQGGDFSNRVVPSTAFDWNWDAPAERLQLDFGGQEYALSTTWTGEGKPHGVEPLANFRMTLELDGRTQDLITRDWCCDEAFPHLLWAGDLDGDGALDLLVEASHHYNLSKYTLYLSTAASPGEMVGKVAEFATTGC